MLTLPTSPWLGALLVFAVTVLFIARLRNAAFARAWTEAARQSSLRMIHRQPTPRIGGLAVAFALACSAAALTWFGVWAWSRETLAIALGGLLCAGLGVLDDRRGLPARGKFAAQIVIACIAVAAGVSWPALALQLPGWAVHGLVVLWLLVAVNAVNLIDGLDGLACGICGIAFAAVAYLANTPALAQLAWASLAATFGVLVWNRHPARVFLGDGGSYLLGFVAGALILQVPMQAPDLPLLGGGLQTIVAFLTAALTPVLFLFVPILDLGFAVLRRARLGQPLFSSDADHIHHRLLRMGLSHPQATRALWALAAAGAGVGIWQAQHQAALLAAFIPMAILAAWIGFGYHTSTSQAPKELSQAFARLRQLAQQQARDNTFEEQHLHIAWQILAPFGITGLVLHLETSGRTYKAGRESGSWGALRLPLNEGSGSHLIFHLEVRLLELQTGHVALIEECTQLLSRLVTHKDTLKFAA